MRSHRLAKVVLKRSAHSRHGVYIHGLERTPIRDVVIRDSAFRGVTNGHVIEGDVDLNLQNVMVDAAAKKEEEP